VSEGEHGRGHQGPSPGTCIGARQFRPPLTGVALWYREGAQFGRSAPEVFARLGHIARRIGTYGGIVGADGGAAGAAYREASSSRCRMAGAIGRRSKVAGTLSASTGRAG